MAGLFYATKENIMKKLAFTSSLFVLAFASFPAHAGSDVTNAQLQQQMQAMMARIDALESENNTLRDNISSVEDSVATGFEGIEPAAGGMNGTKIKFGGYVKADFMADIGSAYGADFVKHATIPLDNSNEDDQSNEFNAHARQTRLSVTTTTPTDIGDIKVFAEVDFYGSEGSELVTNPHAPELRQAYGQVGGLLAGQTWTNFVDLAAWPDSLDFRGVAGTTVMRQAQIRYSGDVNDQGLGYSVSLENPFSDYTSDSGDTVTGSERYPDLVGALTQKADWGHVSLRGVLRDISVENTTDSTDESELGYGLSLTSKIKVGDKDNFKFRVAYGDGLGRYLYDVATSAKGASYNNDTLETNKVFGGYAAYQHHWTDTLRSNLIGGYVDMDNATNLIGTDNNETIWSSNVNLIWQPVKKYSVGVEYIHADREREDGLEGSLDRVQASFTYKFN